MRHFTYNFGNAMRNFKCLEVARLASTVCRYCRLVGGCGINIAWAMP